MVVSVIGGRDFADYELLKFKLMPYRASITKITSGGAKGADSLAVIYAKENNIPIKEFEAEWDNLMTDQPIRIKTNAQGNNYNALAGFNRNTQIVKAANLIVVFWDGKSPGTRDSIGKAHKMKKDILIIYY